MTSKKVHEMRPLQNKPIKLHSAGKTELLIVFVARDVLCHNFSSNNFYRRENVYEIKATKFGQNY